MKWKNDFPFVCMCNKKKMQSLLLHESLTKIYELFDYKLLAQTKYHPTMLTQFTRCSQKAFIWSNWYRTSL
jgi:hypothetical protein